MTVDWLTLDASAAFAWAADEEGRGEQLDPLMRSSRFVSPTLWRMEVVNIVRTSVRRGRLDQSKGNELLAYVEELDVMIVDPFAKTSLSDTDSLARESGLTAYDAAYLSVARTRRAPLLTLDQRLRSAAGDLAYDLDAAPPSEADEQG